MRTTNLLILIGFSIAILSCGKVGPLTLPEEKLNKSLITYPCNEECKAKFEEEKLRQQSVILKTE